MRRLVLSAVLLGGCATGFGEEATGSVDLSLLPGGNASGGVRFDRALLTVGDVELVAAEEAEEPADDGHGHSHLTAALRAATADVHDETTIDLLDGEQALAELTVPVATYEAAHVELAPAEAGAAASCALFATGTTTLDEQSVPVRICVPGGLDVDVALDAHVELDEETHVRFFFAVNELLQDVQLETLERADDGSLVIDSASNAGVLDTIRENVAGAITVAG